MTNILTRHFLVLFSFTILLNFSKVNAQQFCNPSGNLIVYSNYDGGIVTINIDQNIPNLKVGICTYEPVQVTFTGPFVGNITEVIYAGFNSAQNNNNCGQGNFPTSISGVAAGLITINPPQNPPSVGYTPAHGNGAGPWGGIMIGVSGQCDTLNSAGGGNTPDEVVYYFENQTGAQLYFHNTQYNCYLNNTFNISDGGTCCIEPPGSNPTNICDVNGNVVLYSNYEGGVLNINVDQNIPNLKFGICTYEATEVNFSGPFVGNITEVIYAGFNGPNNSNCGSNIPTTSINGVAPGIVTIYSGNTGSPAIANYLGEPLGPGLPPLVNCMVGAEGDCSSSNAGGGNSANQIAQFFLSEFGPGSSIYTHTLDYSCFTGSYSISAGGNCCFIAPTTPLNPIYEGGNTYGFIADDEYSLCNGPLTIDLSNYPVLFQPPTYPGYVWSDGTTGPIITITTPGVYSFIVGDYCHYDASSFLTDTIVVLACCIPPSDPIGTVSAQPDCFNQNGTISITSPLGSNLEYSVDGITYQSSPIFNNLPSGVYSLSVHDILGDCFSEGVVNLTINPAPSIPIISITPNFTTITVGDSVQLNASGGINYNWSATNDLSCENCPNPYASPIASTTYTVSGTNADGCTSEATVTILVITPCNQLFVPTIFSPNGTGVDINNTICVKGDCIGSFIYTVFNRWGEKVFETSEQSICWDGTFKGKELNPGVFTYSLKVTLTNGEIILESGNVTLVR